MAQLGPDLGLDPLTGDLELVGGDFVLRVDVAQSIGIRLRFFLGEWFLNTEIGLPYFEELFAKSPNLSHFAALAKKTILETPGFGELTQFDFETAPKRRLRINWAGTDDKGEQISGEALQ